MEKNNTQTAVGEKNPQSIWNQLHEEFFNLVNEKMMIGNCEEGTHNTYETNCKIMNELSLQINDIRKKILSTNKYI